MCRQTRRGSQAGRMTRLPVSGRCQLVSDCSAHGYTTTTCLPSNSHPTDASSPLQPRRLFGSTSVGTATLSSTSHSESPTHSTTPSLGREIANTSLLYLPARSFVSTPPLAQRFLNGPFTATNTAALHWKAMAHSSRPPQTHQSRSGTLRHTSKSDLSSSIQLMSTAWPSRQITTL